MKTNLHQMHVEGILSDSDKTSSSIS